MSNLEFTIVRANVHIELDSHLQKFVSNAVLRVVVNDCTKLLRFDACGLQVLDCSLKQGKQRQPCKCFYSPCETELCVAPAAGQVSWKANQECELHFRCHGVITRRLSGIFVLDPLSKDRNAVPLVVVHSEPAFASLVFPCSVNPASRFEIVLSVTFSTLGSKIPWAVSDLDVVANSVLAERVEADKDICTWMFDPTSALPSYLFTFALGHFDSLRHSYISVRCSTGIVLRLCIPVFHFPACFSPKAGRIAKEFMESLVQCISIAEDYFDLPLPQCSLNLILVPSFLLMGMENDGCIYLHVSLADADVFARGASKEKDKVAAVLKRGLLHEVLHLWVGNATGLSMRLKEGIVMYLEASLGDVHFPLLGIPISQSQPHDSAKGAGSVAGKIPCSACCKGVDLLHQRFTSSMNPATYAEYESNVRDILTAIGPATFRKNIRQLLTAHCGEFVPDDVAERVLRGHYD
jgi:aminopeptidase N